MWYIYHHMGVNTPLFQIFSPAHVKILAAWVKLYTLTSYVSIMYHILSALLAKLSKLPSHCCVGYIALMAGTYPIIQNFIPPLRNASTWVKLSYT